MKFHTTDLAGAHLVELTPHGDDRGYFSRLFCVEEFAAAGLESQFVQINESYNASAATLRGMHLQAPPFAEVKLVRCLRGSLWDCIVDLRPDSPTFKQWFGQTLSRENKLMMYVPRGFAHGFITLEPDSLAVYLASSPYDGPSERGVRFNDPEFAIDWPIEPAVISEKDAAWGDYHPDMTQEFAGL